MNRRDTGPIQEAMSEVVRATRLGTCYDAITRDVRPSRNSFDLAKLNGAKRILFVTGSGKFEFAANSNNYSEQNSSCWGASGSVSSGIFACKVAASFKMEHSHAEARDSSQIRAFVSYRYVDYFLRIQDADERTYFNCLLPDCKEALEAILAADDVQERFERYTAFKRSYGTGCVTKLYLGAGSIAKISIDVDGHAASAKSKYEGKVTVSSVFGNAESAGGWAKEHQEAGLEGHVRIEAVDYPATSPTKDWVHALVDRFAAQGIEKLSEKQAWAALPQVDFNPQHPFTQTAAPDKDDMPVKKDVAFSDELKAQIMEEEAFEGEWDDFVEKQRQLLEEVDKNKIVGDAATRGHDAGRLATAATSISRDEAETLVGASPGDTGSDWDLGDYQPVDFEVKDWEELFPSLRSVLRPPTTTNIVFAKLVTHYYTRLQFGQYLQFLKDVYDNLDRSLSGKVEDVHCDNDIVVYFGYCDRYLRTLFQEARGRLTEEAFLDHVGRFEAGLHDDGLEFFNREAYRIFFANYDLFARCPYGFIVHGLTKTKEAVWTADPTKALLLQEGLVDPHGRGMLPKAGPYAGLQGELPKAKRLYPAILTRRDGGDASADIWLVNFGHGGVVAPSGGYLHYAQDGDGGMCEFHIGQDYTPGKTRGAELSVTGDGFVRTRVEVVKGGSTLQDEEMPLLRCVGFGDVAKGRVVRGVAPMFRDFPFEEAKSFPG